MNEEEEKKRRSELAQGSLDAADLCGRGRRSTGWLGSGRSLDRGRVCEKKILPETRERRRRNKQRVDRSRLFEKAAAVCNSNWFLCTP